MGSYIYRLCKRPDCRRARMNDIELVLGLYEYDHKPWSTFDPRSDKLVAKAYRRVELSWKDLPRPRFCVSAYRNDETGGLELSVGASVMRYKSDIVLDDDYFGNPKWLHGKITWDPDGVLRIIPSHCPCGNLDCTVCGGNLDWKPGDKWQR